MKYVTAAVATLALAFGGCAGESTRETDSNNASSNLGSAEAALTLPEGFSIDSVTYQVTGNGITARGGNIDVANSSVLRFRIGNLPLTSDDTKYTLALTSNTVGSPSYPCAGTVDFPITSTDVTSITMTLTCGGGVTYEPDENGDIRVSVDVVQGNGTVCPVATGITALPLETAVGGMIKLEGYSSSAATSAWTGDGTFAAASSAATDYTCVSGGIHTLTYTISKQGCDDSALTVDVECTGAEVDSSVPDSSVPDSSVPDSDVPDSDVPDSTTPPSVWATCEACVTANCSNYSGLDLSTPCFSGSGNFLGTDASPAWSQKCTDAMQCSVESSCAASLDTLGADCYCGTDIPTCQQTGPVASAPCAAQWAAATGPDCAANDFTCVLNNFSATTLPAGNAFFAMQCAFESCGTQCAF